MRFTGMILSGGEGRRVGGADKGLMLWQGEPVICQSLRGLKSCLEPVVISANRSMAHYRQLAAVVLPDAPEFAGMGPMAGVLSGLRWLEQQPDGAAGAALVVCPCDTPGFGAAHVRTLMAAARQAPDRVTVARTADGFQPLHAVFPVSAAESLEAFLHAGQRKVITFASQIGLQPVDFPESSPFRNCNRPEDFSQAP